MVICLIRRAWKRSLLFPFREPWVIALFVFLIIGGISILYSAFPRESLRGFTKLMKSALLLIAVSTFLDRPGRWQKAGWAIALGMLTVSLDGFYQYWQGEDLLRQRPLTFHLPGLKQISAASPDANSFGIYLAPFLAFIYGFRLMEHGVRKYLLMLVFVLGSAALGLTFSRGSFIGYLAAVFLLCLLMKDWRLPAILVGAILIGALLLPSQIRTWAFERSSATDFLIDSGPIVSRPRIWKATMEMIRDRPLFGFGVNAYAKNLPAYYTKYMDPKDAVTSPHAHQNFLQMTAELGFLGFGTFLTFLFLLYRKCLKSFWNRNLPQERRWLLLGALAGSVGFLANGFFESNLYYPRNNVYFYFLLGWAVSLCVKEG